MIIQGILEKEKKRRFFAASWGFPISSCISISGTPWMISFTCRRGIENSPEKSPSKMPLCKFLNGKPQHKLEGPLFLKTKWSTSSAFQLLLSSTKRTLFSPAARTSSSNWLKAPSALPLSSKNAPTAPFPNMAKFGQDLMTYCISIMIYTWNLFGLYFGGWSWTLQNKV